MGKRSGGRGLLRVLEKPGRRYEAAGVSFRVKHVLVSDHAARTLARGGGVAWRRFCAAHRLHEIGDGDVLLVPTRVIDGRWAPAWRPSSSG